MSEQDHALFAVADGLVRIGIQSLEAELQWRRVMVPGTWVALDHSALHLRCAIGHADVWVRRAEALESVYQVLPRILSEALAGDKDEAHGRHADAHLLGAREQLAHVGGHT